MITVDELLKVPICSYSTLLSRRGVSNEPNECALFSTMLTFAFKNDAHLGAKVPTMSCNIPCSNLDNDFVDLCLCYLSNKNLKKKNTKIYIKISI